MNYDLDTKQGMANAIAWTNALLNQLKEGGTWIIPRSNTVVTVVSHDDKQVKVTRGELPDPAIARVLKAAGWNLISKAES